MSLTAQDVRPDGVPGPVPIEDRRRRELLGCALWAAAALLWTAAVLVPWFRAGALAQVSPIEAGGALRTGLVGIPPAAALAVLLLPLTAWVLLALAPARGRSVLVVRVVLWVLSSAGGLTAVLLMASVSAATYGVGAALVLLACLVGAGALACSTVATDTDTDRAGR